MRHKFDDSNQGQILTTAKDYFKEVLGEAMDRRKLFAKPIVQKYLEDLLEFYLFSQNLFDIPDENGRTETMAEKFLKATQGDNSEKAEQLKRLGDTALYVSGFFGDSFKRKIIDIDYYISIGGSAYGALASSGASSVAGVIYQDLAGRFGAYVDVFTYISQKSLIQSDNDLLRIYDRYIATGSKLAEEQLEENGMFHASLKKAKVRKQ